MKKLKYSIRSFRLRTLPLSVAGIILGSMLAAGDGFFNTPVFCLAIFTTLCLQILSNISNDLGDALKGTDNEQRVGPIRALQAGVLTTRDYRRLIRIFALLSVISGLTLVCIAFRSLTYKSILILFLGGTAIVSALKYTMWKNPYGYRGLGDLFVFLFFGLLSTLGAYFLMRHSLGILLLLPATALGFLTTAVLNVNNIRDMENDARCGKNTIPVKIGEKKARIYHCILICGAFICMTFYTLFHPNGIGGFLFFLSLPLFSIHLSKMLTLSGKSLDPQLKFLSISTLLFALLSGAGQIF